MRRALSILLAVSSTGCVVTTRTSLGPSASNLGGEERASLGAGVGLADDKGQIVVVGAIQPGTRSLSGVGGIEYDRNLRTEEKPLGIRVRLEGGVQAPYDPPIPDDTGRALVTVVPGVWWIPFQNVYDAHRFVMAIEPRLGVAIPTNDPSAVGPFFDLSFVMEWDWVPCTFFGAGSCRPFPAPMPAKR
ncbi:MAG: hypothetical protein U0414_30940 [Polyangiaceae bacterium]